MAGARTTPAMQRIGEGIMRGSKERVGTTQKWAHVTHLLAAVRDRVGNAWHGRPPRSRFGGGGGYRDVLDDLALKFVVSNEPLLDVVAVTVLANHTLHVEFSNGRCHLFSMAPYLAEAPYDQLSPTAFSQAHIANGTVTWPGGIDIAPELLLEPVMVCAVHGR